MEKQNLIGYRADIIERIGDSRAKISEIEIKKGGSYALIKADGWIVVEATLINGLYDIKKYQKVRKYGEIKHTKQRVKCRVSIEELPEEICKIIIN